MLRSHNSMDKRPDDSFTSSSSTDRGLRWNRDSGLMDESVDGSRVELIPSSPSSSETTLPTPAIDNQTGAKPKKTKKPRWPLCLRGESWTVKCWINFLILLVLSLFVLIVFLATYETSDKDKFCLTPVCIQAASHIIQSMDDSIDPCDDFYEYACGGWNRINVLPDDTPKYSTFRKLTDDLHAKLKDALERPIDGQDIEPVKNLKLLYLSCINEFSLQRLGTDPVMRYLDELGGWPVLNKNWNESQFDMISLMAQLTAQDVHVFVNLRVGANIRQSNNSIIHLDQASLGLVSEIYFLGNNSVYSAYYDLAVGVAVELGASREEAETDMIEVLLLESRLANITVPDQERRDLEKVYHSMTVGDLPLNLTEWIDWLRYLQLVFKDTSKNISEERVIGVFVPEYFQRLGQLLKQTSPRTIANYMFWRTVYSKIGFLPEKIIELRKALRKAAQGTSTEKSRWKQCIGYVIDDMSMASGRIFVDRYFDRTAKERAGELIDHLKAAFIELLREVEWMNDETRKVAMEKANGIREAIGYPDFILDDIQITDAYKGLMMNSTTLFDNVVRLSKWSAKMVLGSLDQTIDEYGWSKSPAVVNAYYSASKNLILFPAGILQPPFYHGENPGYLNYGSMGMIIGHEITHGFDDKGRRFDKDGNMVQWWPSDVIEKFKERAECIIKQYAEYEINDIAMKINGHQTQGENIADNGGLKQAFRAYRKFIQKRGHEEARLPGLDLSPNQLFFLSFAQIWCQQSRPENMMKAILSERHSPDRFRVIGSLVNSHDFSQVYKCRSGSKMNPNKKCAVW